MSPKKSKGQEKTKEDDQVKELEARIEDMEKKIKENEDKAERYLNQLKYAKADLENIQKQSQRRMTDILEKANGELLQQLLPVLEELEMLYTKDAEKDKLVEGVKMVHKKLLKIMESQGVQPILAQGYKFDPFKHEAIQEVETSEEPEGYVLEEVRRGYMFKDRVLRASVVKVAKNPENKKQEEVEDE
jgi:molecular chaperone GrpE